ncbi:MAG TPA: M28 family peptidase [Gemmatimonadales bacterium]
MRRLRIVLPALALACGGHGSQPTVAPTPTAAPAAPVGVASITADGIRGRIYRIADDSMRGRATPSPELDKMAAYVAAEFRRFGLRPGGDGGGYLQRYPLEVYQAVPESAAVWTTGVAPVRWSLGQDMKFVQGQPVADRVAEGAVLIIGTPQSGGTLDSATVTGKIAVVPIGTSGFAAATALLPRHPAAIVAVFDVPDAAWLQFPSQTGKVVQNPNEGGGLVIPPILVIRDASARDWLARAGVNIDSARAATTGPLAARALPGVTIHVDLPRRLLQRTTAPNVVGILEGSDPVLKHQYVIFSGHMDHIGTPPDGEGCAPRGADSICNGADDDGTGSVAVLELAQAFASAPVRTKRSLVFLTVSGEERGLWGSAYFANHPTVPIDSIVADLNSDMVGRSDTLRDSIVAIGREHSDLGTTLDRVAGAHPELRMTPVGDRWPQEQLFFRSDHYNFARKGIPILFFTSGLHPDYHQVSDTPDRIDTEKEARFVRLEYYLGETVANAAQKPQWNPDSYQKIVQGSGH